MDQEPLIGNNDILRKELEAAVKKEDELPPST
jgi:hypothetical protein